MRGHQGTTRAPRGGSGRHLLATAASPRPACHACNRLSGGGGGGCDPDDNYVANCRYKISRLKTSNTKFFPKFPHILLNAYNYCRLLLSLKLFIVAKIFQKH